MDDPFDLRQYEEYNVENRSRYRNGKYFDPLTEALLTRYMNYEEQKKKEISEAYYRGLDKKFIIGFNGEIIKRNGYMYYQEGYLKGRSRLPKIELERNMGLLDQQFYTPNNKNNGGNILPKLNIDQSKGSSPRLGYQPYQFGPKYSLPALPTQYSRQNAELLFNPYYSPKSNVNNYQQNPFQTPNRYKEYNMPYETLTDRVPTNTDTIFNYMSDNPLKKTHESMNIRKSNTIDFNSTRMNTDSGTQNTNNKNGRSGLRQATISNLELFGNEMQDMNQRSTKRFPTNISKIEPITNQIDSTPTPPLLNRRFTLFQGNESQTQPTNTNNPNLNNNNGNNGGNDESIGFLADNPNGLLNRKVSRRKLDTSNIASMTSNSNENESNEVIADEGKSNKGKRRRRSTKKKSNVRLSKTDLESVQEEPEEN